MELICEGGIIRSHARLPHALSLIRRLADPAPPRRAHALFCGTPAVINNPFGWIRNQWYGALDRGRDSLAEVEKSSGLTLLCVLGAIVGGLCGLAVLGLVESIRAVQGLMFAAHEPGNFEYLSLRTRVALPLLGAIVLALIFGRLARESREGGIVHIVERMVYYQGYLPVKTAVVQFVSVVIAVASGQSVGREGAAAHIGATAGSLFGQRLALPNNSLRTLVGCGTAAGIAASFNTPLGGVIFAMEVVMMEYSIVSFAPIILAAVSATTVAHLFTSTHPSLDVHASQIVSLYELPYLVLCGAIIGLASAGFTRSTAHVIKAFGRFRIETRLLTAGLVTAGAAALVPQIMGVGFETINVALAGQFGIGLCLAVFAAKFIATVTATAAAMPGGVILPGFVMGATLGGALGMAGNLVAEGLASPPGFYALMGIGAMIGAMLQAPLTALVILLELSGTTALLLPGMLAVITAIVVARRLEHSQSVFRMLLQQRGLDYRNDPVSQYLRRLSVAAAMNRRFQIVDQEMSREALDAVLKRKLDWLILRTGDKRATLMRPGDALRYINAEDNRSLETLELNSIPGQRLEAQPISLRASLQEAYDALRKQDVEALFVERVTRTGQVNIQGVITRESVEGAYHP